MKGNKVQHENTVKQIKFSRVHYSDRKFSAIQCKSSVCCCFQIELNAVQLCAVLCCALQCSAMQCSAVHNIVQKSSAGLLLLASAAAAAAISPNPIRGLILRMSPHTALSAQTTLRTVHSTHCAQCIAHTAHCTLY